MRVLSPVQQQLGEEPGRWRTGRSSRRHCRHRRCRCCRIRRGGPWLVTIDFMVFIPEITPCPLPLYVNQHIRFACLLLSAVGIAFCSRRVEWVPAGRSLLSKRRPPPQQASAYLALQRAGVHPGGLWLSARKFWSDFINSQNEHIRLQLF